MLEKLVMENRTCRSFDPNVRATRERMLSLVELARCTASGMNRQPLRYRILCEKSDVAAMTRSCRFAMKLGIPLPPEGQNPTGFILIFIDRR